MDGCWFRPLCAIALATDVVEVRLDLREAFEFPMGRVDKHGDVQPDDMDLDARLARRGKPWCADIDGYSLHAGVTVRGADDVGRENLCRYVLRHPISLSRLGLTSDGRVAYEMKYPRGRKTHLLMEPYAMAWGFPCSFLRASPVWCPHRVIPCQVRGRAVERVAMA